MSNQANFDYWLYSTSWAPSFCCTNSKVCNAERMNGVNALMSHGLWPSYRTAVSVIDKEGNPASVLYPSFCRADPSVASSVSGLRGRRKHEWSKHGTCSGLSSSAYFQAESFVATGPQIRALQDYLQAIVISHHQESARSLTSRPPIVDVRAVQAMLGGPDRVAIKTSKFCVLQELTVCLARSDNASNSVGPQQSCPTHILNSDRNSAISMHGCETLVLENALAAYGSSASNRVAGISKDANSDDKQCVFVTQALLKELKSRQVPQAKQVVR